MTVFVKFLIFSMMIGAGSAWAASADEVGKAVVNSLSDRYNDTTEGCGADKKTPAFDCSGILIRITGNGDYDPWDPSPSSRDSGGISFSFLRKDVFSKLFTQSESAANGYILDAPANVGAGKIVPYVLCYFPLNASTRGRAGERGCGEHPQYDEEGKVSGVYVNASSPCQLQGILTSTQWSAALSRILDLKEDAANHTFEICGFNVRQVPDVTARDAFYQGILSSSFIKANQERIGKVFRLNNEVLLGVWETGIARKLPIQAFFYVNDSGRKIAQKDQKTFSEKTGVFVPVIRVSSIDDGAYSFSYSPDDQSVQP